MDALQDDIQDLNSQLLLIVSEPHEGAQILKLMEATPLVAQRIAQAGANGVGTAIRCRTPLVTFTALAEELLALDPRDWRGSGSMSVPQSLQDLTLYALRLAQRVAHVQPTVAELQFQLSRSSVEALARLPLKHLNPLCRRYGVLLRLRRAQQPQIWERLLIGDTCPGPLGFRIAQQTALLSLGNN